jgi:hypothetical protein
MAMHCISKGGQNGWYHEGVMRRIRILLALGCCCFTLAVFVWAQKRKAGLWEMTASPSGASPSTGPHTTLVCVSQQMLDKYDAIIPQIRGCRLSNIVRKSNGTSADIICTGAMNGKGTLESTAIDSEHAKGSMHLVVSVKAGENTRTIEMATESSSVFKSADCGAVKPLPMPDN